MSPMPKHLRPRWRYLGVAIETWPDAEFDRGAFQRDLWYAAQNLLGDPGSADADLTVVRFESPGGGDVVGEGAAVVRVRRGEEAPARAALACVDEVAGEPVGLRARGISGTVRACSERYLGGAGRISGERDVAYEGDRWSAHVRDGSYDIEHTDGFLGAAALDVD